MTPTQSFFLNTALMIIGSLGIGFAIGCKVMARRAKQMLEAETLEENDTILDAEELTTDRR